MASIRLPRIQDLLIGETSTVPQEEKTYNNQRTLNHHTNHTNNNYAYSKQRLDWRMTVGISTSPTDASSPVNAGCANGSDRFFSSTSHQDDELDFGRSFSFGSASLSQASSSPTLSQSSGIPMTPELEHASLSASIDSRSSQLSNTTLPHLSKNWASVNQFNAFSETEYTSSSSSGGLYLVWPAQQDFKQHFHRHGIETGYTPHPTHFTNSSSATFHHHSTKNAPCYNEHNTSDTRGPNQPWGLTKAKTVRKRMTTACDLCRKKKIRCEPQGDTCLQCRKTGSPCQVDVSRRRGKKVSWKPAT